jgi:hypothetical protein
MGENKKSFPLESPRIILLHSSLEGGRGLDFCKRQKQKSEITIPLQPFHHSSVSSIPEIGLGIFPFCRYYISER